MTFDHAYVLRLLILGNMEGGVAKLRISGDELLAVEETTSRVLKQIFGFLPSAAFGKLAGLTAGEAALLKRQLSGDANWR